MADPATLRVCALYPDLLNIYADRGNLLMLRRRCEWRGLGFELRGSRLGDQLTSGWAALYYIGGGQDRDQELCALDLQERKREALVDAAAGGAAILGVCGGYQLLGHSYRLAAGKLAGVGLLDIITTRERGARLSGNAAVSVALDTGGERVLAGFENHAGRTQLGAGAQALGRVLRGHGNNGSDGLEGARAGNVIGTYLHGPLLPKNAWFADYLIATALGVAADTLAPLDDRLEAQAHREAQRAAGL